MKLIAIEEHFLTREVSDAWAAAPGPVDPTCAYHAGDLAARLEDLGDMRLDLMDETGVDVQVLSLTTPGLHNLEAGASAALARRTNELLDRLSLPVSAGSDRPNLSGSDPARCVGEGEVRP